MYIRRRRNRFYSELKSHTHNKRCRVFQELFLATKKEKHSLYVPWTKSKIRFRTIASLNYSRHETQASYVGNNRRLTEERASERHGPRDVIYLGDINNRVVKTHHQLACAPFCHATSRNGTTKKVVRRGRIFVRIRWTVVDRWVVSMEKKKGRCLSVRALFQPRILTSVDIDRAFASIADPRGWQIEIERSPLSELIAVSDVPGPTTRCLYFLLLSFLPSISYSFLHFSRAGCITDFVIDARNRGG